MSAGLIGMGIFVLLFVGAFFLWVLEMSRRADAIEEADILKHEMQLKVLDEDIKRWVEQNKGE